ncbi:AvrBs1/Avra family type III secretion system effector [Paracidovorax citrulli]|nr:AvrBs1/Avra family type III secretion system effector [Paracidovorax citrulli]
MIEGPNNHRLPSLPFQWHMDSSAGTQADPHVREAPETLPTHPHLRARGRACNRLAPRARIQLEQMLEKKRQVQDVARIYSKASTAAAQGVSVHRAADPVLPRVTRGAEMLQERFANGEAAMIRTLRFSCDQEATEHFGGSGKTPAKREVDTLANRVLERDIVMTPSCVIAPDAQGSMVSIMERRHRPKWKGLPSLVYLPEQASWGSHHPQLHRRTGFGDIHSFSSNKGFDEEYAKAAPQLSQAARLEMLERKSRPFMKQIPDRPSEGFSHSPQELAREMRMLQAGRPGEILHHNEYCAKLELWDARALEAGASPAVAIATMVEFNLEMSAMARELESEGIDGHALNAFLARQMSWSPDGAVRDLDSTLESLQDIDARERQQILEGICEQLREGISLCTYRFQDQGSRIRTLGSQDFSAEDILQGLRLFLSSKVQHVA